jgi:aminopeptidase N
MNYLCQICPAFVLLLFVLTNITLAQQPQEIKKLPPVNLPRSRTIDVKHIALDLRFDWRRKQAYGSASLTLSLLNPTDKISLDAGMLTINSIKSGEKTLKFDYDGGDKNDNLKITLDRNYQANEEVTVKIDYRTNWVNEIDPNSLGGNNGKGLRFNEPTSDDPIKVREIWSFGDPESNCYWFPSYDAPNDLRTTEFTATVDKKLTVISNGSLIKTTDNADGTRTFHYKTDTPYPNFLTSFIVGEFVNIKKNYEGIELNNFGNPREKDWIDASTERLPDMVKYFSEKIGVKYPYPSYSQVFVQDINGGGFTSNMSVSTITENMVDDFPTHADFFYLWDSTEAEALAGQWFGNYVFARDWHDVWLNKGFAHYFTRLYDEHKNGNADWLLWLNFGDQAAYFGDWNAGIRRPVVTRNYDDTLSFTNDNYAAIRGAMVLKMLHKHLGEENWWKAIRRYVKTNANKSVTTADFQKAIEESTGEKLDWFFDQWIYKMGHPIFEVTKNYANSKLTLNVKQTQTIDSKEVYPQAEFFQGKIEIEIDGKIEQVWLKPQAENVFTFSIPNSPNFVNFDYENTWIRELKYEQSFDELLATVENSKDVLAKRSAMTELASIGKDEKTSANDKAKITNALRNKVLSNEYWRVRNFAMFQLAGLYPSDEATISTLLTVINNEKSWFKTNAIMLLGNTKNPKYADLYINSLNDPSFRVINQAAIALGKTKSPKAFDALAKLTTKPSMKSQSLLCALGGLKELGDPRVFDIAYKALSDLSLPRWRLPGLPPYWDYRGFAADTIKSLGKSDKAYPLIFERFKKSMDENDMNGIFYNVVLIVTLADSRGQEVFEMLKARFKDDANAMSAVNQYETQFKDAVKQ